MKKRSFYIQLLAICSLLVLENPTLHAQNYRPLIRESWTESDSDSLHYTIKGYRHGTSVFTQHRFPEVEYEAGEVLSWDRYHSVDVMYSWLSRWAGKYPDLTDLYEVGKSYEGRPILQITLTNKKTGKDTDKPAAFFEGGRHSGEVTSSESALWLIDHLLSEYGKDPEITELLDTKTIYVRPENNPDGSNLYLHSALRNRSSVRPTDNDQDSLLDEDEAEDLDGDGVIYTMRWIDLEKGSWIPDPRDSSGQLLKNVGRGKGLYSTGSEGIDNDLDGERNEDGIGGLDLHRNYPENWRPDQGLDQTGRGYTQSGAGAFPLSEPETRAVFTFLMQHPNISVVNSMDTRVPMHLRGPSTDFSEKVMPPADYELFQYFDSLGMALTGYPWAGDTYDTYNTRYPVSLWSGDSTKPSPLFGHGPDFGYSYYGAIWYGDELWNGGRYKDYDGDGEIDDYDVYQWDQLENKGEGFKAWKRFQHPELGLVEIGGFHPKFFAQNPPARHLEPWIRKQALFNLAMCLELPRLEWISSRVKKLKSDSDSTDYRIDLSWTNSGLIPTALQIADQVKIVTKDAVSLVIDPDYLKSNPESIKIVQPAGQSKIIETNHLGKDQRAEASFVVRVYTKDDISLTARVSSTRGGILTKQLKLK